MRLKYVLYSLLRFTRRHPVVLACLLTWNESPQFNKVSSSEIEPTGMPRLEEVWPPHAYSRFCC